MQTTAISPAADAVFPEAAPSQSTATVPDGISPPEGLFGALNESAKIMIVDDEALNIRVMQRHLELAGYRHFVTSDDPRPVVDMVQKEMPDVILLDVMMPEVSGLEILRRNPRGRSVGAYSHAGLHGLRQRPGQARGPGAWGPRIS